MIDLPMRADAGTAPADLAVVLVHGYLCVWPTVYWAGLLSLRRTLSARGVQVVISRQPRTGSVEDRARQLAVLLERIPATRVVLVGHSMGGLDARWVASRLDPYRRVSHVVTVGTPHHGTRLAEEALRSSCWRGRLARLVDRGALRDLAPEGAARLNERMPDREDVTYVSLAGAVAIEDLPSFLRPLGDRLACDEGPNDGLVSLRSAGWGRRGETVLADHLGLIGAPLGAPPAFARQRSRAQHALAALARALGELTHPPLLLPTSARHLGGREHGSCER